ncbi:PRP3-domain-containing protein [Coprinopsis marcescibilis]|uniref:PRP3-domain-containing protein n=1 Tax=Coprinopsis marcescibilis TaxID=230819 RepID=A0A5C3KPS9_COPMA|nr:PRP3-domain-containing protein [Coprinopsis marcescibilis]
MSDKKRALETNGGAEGANKKFKRYASQSLQPFSAQLIAQKKAEIAAKMAQYSAAAKAGTSAGRAPVNLVAPAPRVPVVPPSMPSRVVSSQATPSPSISSIPTPASGSTSSTPAFDDIAKRVADAKRRVAAAQTQLAMKENPYMAQREGTKKKGSGTPQVEPVQQGAGLKMAAHPLLLDQTHVLQQSKKDRYKPMQPKFASIKANVRNAATPTPAPVPISAPSPIANPYSTAGKEATGTGFEGAPKERSGRNFRFNPKGKYVALANQMRHEQQLEELKQRIAETARKAGLDSELGIEKNIKRLAPPDCEWWDSSLLPNKNYADVDQLGLDKLFIRTNNSPISIYVQHPIPIPAPGDNDKVVLKPLMLTTKEQKKIRKQRRQGELQDKRDRQKMGLLPPDPPKVKLSNLMRVLTSDAIQDPTRVEARVRREVAIRKHTHEKANAERKLTDDQRREKKENKKMAEDKRGICGAIYKVKVLSDPAHQFKVRKNADQLNLTGVCIFNPQFSMVYVEGAPKFMKNYRRLMLNRIAWTEPARPRGGDEVELENPDSDVEGQDEATSSNAKGKGKTTADEDEAGRSLEDNKCWLVWEGALRDRAFVGFKAKSCPTDRDAKEFLGEKLKGYWDMSKNWKPEEEELF